MPQSCLTPEVRCPPSATFHITWSNQTPSRLWSVDRSAPLSTRLCSYCPLGPWSPPTRLWSLRSAQYTEPIPRTHCMDEHKTKSFFADLWFMEKNITLCHKKSKIAAVPSQEKADPFTFKCWIDISKYKCLLPIFTRTMAFTLECSFCGTVGTLSSHPRTSTPACRPLPARLGDIETRRTAHPGSWHTLYSLQSPGRMQREAGDVYNSLEERRRLCKLHCLIVITPLRPSLRCKCLEIKS